MIAAELRGGNKPSLEEALGWIGSRVDDIYGANVGRLEDVWIDPSSGLPRWLLVKGRFSSRSTLIPFDHATAGAGHVWVPYEREVVRDAPEIQAGARPTPAVEEALLAHYAQRAPREVINAEVPAPPRVPHFQSRPVGRPRRQDVREQPRPQAPFSHHSEFPGYRPIPRPAPPEQRPAYQAPQAPPEPPRAPVPPPPFVPGPAEAGWTVRQAEPRDRATWQAPPPPVAVQQVAPVEEGGWAVGSAAPPPETKRPAPALAPSPPPDPAETLQNLTNSTEASDIEIELSGEISIKGEVVRIRIVPRGSGPERP